jgi:hypothetical protein
MARPRNIEREERDGLNRPDDGMFVTWGVDDAKGRAAAMQQASYGLAKADGVVQRSSAGSYDLGGNVSIRGGMGRGDYNQYRPGEGKPRKIKDIIRTVQECYDEFGIVRNIIDTMTDFTVQGINIVHPNPRINKFMQEWFYQVQGPDISSHIAQNLFLEGNAPVRRHTAKLRRKDEQNLQRGFAQEDGQPPDAPFLLGKRELPWSYTVLNPVQMVVLGGNLVPFLGSGAFTYAVEVTAELATQIRRPRNAIERELIKKLPPNIRKNIEDGLNTIKLDSSKLRVLHYKRRHWQIWATPMTYPILDDLNMLRKLKLADLSALDGAISHIRIWRLGSLEHRMMPTKKAIEKLAEMLANAGNGGSMDLIWGPDLDLKETSSDIYRFLGEAKYVPHLNAIYAGYGIPPTLTGAATEGGFTNNFISLKTLTERLQYVRRLIREFWEYEIALVQQAFGFRLPATVRFDRMVLTDEAAEKALLIQLADRDLISVETIQERFGEDPILEEVRQRQEDRKRQKSRIPKKASPWHNPQRDDDLKKGLLQLGTVAPSQLGLDLPPKKDGEETPMEHKTKLAPKPAPGGPPQRGQPQQGRPLNSKDSKKRKQKVVKPRSKAALMDALAWAEDAMKDVVELTTPVYLKALGKKNLRQLTTEQADNFEKFKFSVLMNLPYGVKATKESVIPLLREELKVPVRVTELLKQTKAKYVEKEGKEPSFEKVREFMCRIVALYKGK